MNPVLIRPITSSEFWSAPNIDDMLAEYASESSIAGLPAPAPSREIYERLEATGLMHVLGAFKDDVLVGFLAMMATTNPHYGVPLAVTESFFVGSVYRKGGAGLKLLHEAEQIAKAAGAQGLLVSAPTASRLADVLPGVGYAETNRVFFRGFA